MTATSIATSTASHRFLFVALAATAMTIGPSLTAGSQAQAGGLMLPTRGVHTTARGGAFIAGARGASALGLNPAGLALTAGDTEFLIDLSYVRHDVAYTRLDSNLLERDTVENGMPGIPIPTLALAVPLGERLTLAGGIYAPYGGAADYPADGPQRYSLISARGSLLLIGELSLGFQLNDRVRVGVGVQNMYVKLANSLAFSACPSTRLCNPEDPGFDMNATMQQESKFNPSGIAGVQIELSDRVHLGAAVQLPYNLSGTGTFQSTMPDLGLGLNVGDVKGQASVALTIPPSMRAGLEIRPWDNLAIELAASVEKWSMSEQLEVSISELDIAGLFSIDPAGLADSGMPLNLRDTYALMAGVETTPFSSLPLTLMAGYAYETSAATDEFINIMTVDGDKHLVTGGLTLGTGKLQLHAVLGVAKVADTTVTPDEGAVPQVNPLLQAANSPPAAFVNWGEYRSAWLIAGLGVSGSL